MVITMDTTAQLERSTKSFAQLLQGGTSLAGTITTGVWSLISYHGKRFSWTALQETSPKRYKLL